MKIKSSKNQYEMQDPTRQYPRPEFPGQTQSPPGLAREMDPKPDHGEESYQGFGRLEGRKALITGADSGIGRAATIAFAREGADIALNYLESERPDAREVIALVEQAGTRAIPLPGDIRDEAFCKRLVEDARKGLGASGSLALAPVSRIWIFIAAISASSSLRMKYTSVVRMSAWPANSLTSCIVAPFRMASLMAVLRKEWMPMPGRPAAWGRSRRPRNTA